MNQKKFITLLLTTIMAFSLFSGCASNQPQQKPQPNLPRAETPAPQDPTKKPESERIVSENLEQLAIDLEKAGYQVYAGITNEEGAIFIAEKNTVLINHYLEVDKRTMVIKTNGKPDETIDHEVRLALDKIYPNQGEILANWYIEAQKQLDPNNPKQLITKDLDNSFTLSLSKVDEETTFTVVPKNQK